MSRIYVYPGAANAKAYELENKCADPDGLVLTHMERIAPFDGRAILDVGAGSGFHVAEYAKRAAHVYAVEPDPNMLKQIHRRFVGRSCGNVSILAASAEDIPLCDGIVDIAYARFAYFFGAYGECDLGIEETRRLLRPAGHFFIIDNYYGEGQFAIFCELANGDNAETQQANEDFYRERGFDVSMIRSSWRAQSREDLRTVIAMTFPEPHVDEIMEQINGVELSCVYAVYHQQKPDSR